ncbi:DUF397 domain-containing protein [Streptomyces sp. WMMC897]|uniref:DUF397 domain-containing protein n=1 Tax=Streptomyces sp. WMMC897 TaxID=3014782 RepID=UPI0022B6C838|nr:DUF397 domain-containing protein [Streptomyces sp. WMMC897]MCZ7414692.1 DUF397 domain-containing protein [Streptomyces sp. WMMC897]
MTLTLSSEDGTTLEWVKSSYSSNDGPACVEVAATPGTVHVRDSKRTDDSPRLALGPTAWAAFASYTSAA